MRLARTMLLALSLVAAPFALPALAQQLSAQERAGTCVQCHGPGGNSLLPGVPSLAGQPQFFLLNQMILMREGVRPVEQMAGLLTGASDAELLALAEHYAAAPVVRSDEPVVPELVRQGAELARQMRCASCHLPDLRGADQMPRLAGQRIDYMFEAMKAYRDDKRPGADTLMTAAIFGASDAALLALAHYAASK